MSNINLVYKKETWEKIDIAKLEAELLSFSELANFESSSPGSVFRLLNVLDENPPLHDPPYAVQVGLRESLIVALSMLRQAVEVIKENNRQ